MRSPSTKSFSQPSTEKKSRAKRHWLTYDEARVFLKPLEIRGQKDYRLWSSATAETILNTYGGVARPENVPSAPHNVYRHEWQGWQHYLGKVSLSPTP